MKNIKKFDTYINESCNKFHSSSVQWSRKPSNWQDVRNSLLLSHLTEAQRNDLIDKHIKKNIYDSVEYDMGRPSRTFGDIWGGSSPQFFIVRYSGGLGTNYYLVDTEGYDYAKYVVRLDDLERWVNIEENLY